MTIRISLTTADVAPRPLAPGEVVRFDVKRSAKKFVPLDSAHSNKMPRGMIFNNATRPWIMRVALRNMGKYGPLVLG